MFFSSVPMVAMAQEGAVDETTQGETAIVDNDAVALNDVEDEIDSGEDANVDAVSSDEVQAVEALIAALPEQADFTGDDIAALYEASDAYDALSQEQQAQVSESETAKLTALLTMLSGDVATVAATVSLTSNGSTTTYSSLASAVSAAQAGAVITLLDNVTLTETLFITKAITLDLNGHTITSQISSATNNSVIFINAAGLTVTIKNGAIQPKTEQNVIWAYRVGALSLEDMVIDGYTIALALNYSNSTDSMNVQITDSTLITPTANCYGIYLFADADLTIGGDSVVRGAYYGIFTTSGTSPSITIKDNATISGPGYAGVCLNGSRDAENPARLTVLGGMIEGVFGISGNGENDYTDITISGGTVKSENYCAIFHPQIGDLTITGGEIIGYDSGIQFSGEGAFYMSGGTVTGTADMELSKPSSQSSGSVLGGGAGVLFLSRGSGYQDGVQAMTAVIEGGKICSDYGSPIIVCRVYKVNNEWVFDEATGILNYLDALSITGGTFIGADAIAIDPLAATEGVISLTGGQYTTAPSAAYIATGLVAQYTETAQMYEIVVDAAQTSTALDSAVEDVKELTADDLGDAGDTQVIDAIYTAAESVVEIDASALASDDSYIDAVNTIDALFEAAVTTDE